ncbi:Condensation domain-containing protein [Ruminococcus sp. YE71]|uniref:condensation domain-containing protein n=1 Tax=unclassified Ruminococcus TaxID=2608920 RepID=UPI00088F9D59|nr:MULTISPECIES: condensation domain-containing protein [unclassified Ruminococcus]SDA29815.1 Condensation domain-containing protein [Ruminococcus sp. YE78]SFW48901.1 Condensation domain-containing protein [Ruminococcus sp. YE71]
MKKLYSLTAAQNMHYQWIKEYKTQQVSGLSIVAAFKADIDVDVLKKSIALEMERYSCLRLRFTAPDENGEIKQYIADCGDEDFEERDLTGMTMQEANDTMQQWAYETFDGDDIPMCEFRIVKLPEGYTGFFVHMDHRLNDSVGVAVMATDIMGVYKHLKYGTEMPAPLADFEKVLVSDLEKAANQKRLAKAKRFWDEQLDELGEPLYSDIQGTSVLEEARRKHNDPDLRAGDIERKELFVAVKDYQLEVDSMQRAINFCLYNQISPTNLILLVIRTYLSKMNGGQEDITIENFISRRSTQDELTSGGSRVLCFPCRTVISGDTTFIDAARMIQNHQNRIYMYSGYDPEFIRQEMKRRYNTPDDTTYVSVYLTYQPPMNTSDLDPNSEQLPIYVKWFANGAATKKMYLTVSHLPDRKLNFSYHYQTAHLTEKDAELMYYYMMRILFRGIEDPGRTISEIIDMV